MLLKRYQIKLNFKTMPITKLDLCKSEWLELVFDDRNKLYGAYDLRKHYSQNLFKALGFTTIGFVGLLLGFSLFLTHQPKPVIYQVIPFSPKVPPVIQKNKPTPPKPPKADPPKQNTVKFPPMVTAVDDSAKNPPKTDEIKDAIIAQTTVHGTTTDGPIEPPTAQPVKDPTEGADMEPLKVVEVMPQFPGGEAAWAKFLQKNIRYPTQAIDAHIQGKVYVSFVVEKDGHLSNINVLRSPGYGLEDEAIRVLKLVPPWKPGIQNGRPVRVSYTMPFSFQLPADDN